MIEKLLGVASVGSTLANVTLLHRFLSGITGVMALAVVSAFLCCVLLAGGFFAAYYMLVSYGLAPLAAGITVLAFVFLLAAILITLTVLRLHRLRELPHKGAYQEIPVLAEVGEVFQSFMDGLLRGKATRN